ncbi:alpha/beta hydrolase [Flavobacterium sp. MAH-1]|uniref:Alpha/beta hydrolase n=1 Tax=Flavobacterium agri TaxID=2743471 RepID=A0A7Y8Y4U4_9FLAO|nr:alpha/beta hydrolase [Flavobacterium agri]NUY82403.1 alpha/beta hydrolase [Flavobacterium agri]NYA72427.1 alpha/beta hydrolase [Flavobacterium agri]
MRFVYSITLFLILGTAKLSAQVTYATETNISYYAKPTDAYIKQRCVLDLYYPKNTKDFATIIWFHGGGLTGGEKEIPKALTEKGYAVVGVNYRLSPKVKVKDCIEDAATAIAWVFSNISKYGGSDNNIFVSGHSAGAYLGAMTVLDKKWLAKYDIDPNKVAGLIPFSGQMITHFTARKEKGIGEKQPLIDEFAPLSFVRADAPPMLLITGDRELEMLGRYEENAYMARMMKLVGHKETRLIEIGGYGHNMAEPAYPILLNEMKRILDQQTKQTN